MLENREGQTIPNITFRTIQEGEWVNVNSDDVFKDKTVVVFALPGAFTPTCSSSHVPRYNELAGVFKANGVDEIVCVSVNDTFVMNAWKKEQDAKYITFIPDGNGEFSDALGMLVDKDNLGFGKRSWRYSMLVKNGVIEKMFIEPDVEGDPFEVSDADTMIDFINPEAVKPEYITLFSRAGCPHCARAKKLLDSKGLVYEDIQLNNAITTRSLQAVTGKATVPQVYMGGKHIGGADELEAFFAGK